MLTVFGIVTSISSSCVCNGGIIILKLFSVISLASLKSTVYSLKSKSSVLSYLFVTPILAVISSPGNTKNASLPSIALSSLTPNTMKNTSDSGSITLPPSNCLPEYMRELVFGIGPETEIRFSCPALKPASVASGEYPWYALPWNSEFRYKLVVTPPPRIISALVMSLGAKILFL